MTLESCPEKGQAPCVKHKPSTESSLLHIRYLIQDLEIDQVVLEAVSVSILHSIGSSGMHPFMPGNMQRVSTSKQCILQKKAGDEGGSLGNPSHDPLSDLSGSESKAHLDATLCLWRHGVGGVSLPPEWRVLPSEATKHTFLFPKFLLQHFQEMSSTFFFFFSCSVWYVVCPSAMLRVKGSKIPTLSGKSSRLDHSPSCWSIDFPLSHSCGAFLLPMSPPPDCQHPKSWACFAFYLVWKCFMTFPQNNSSREVTALWRQSLSLFLSVGQMQACICGQHVGYACWIIKINILGVLLSKCVFVPNLNCCVSIYLCTCALVHVCVHRLSWKPEGHLQEWVLFFYLGPRSWVHVIWLLWQVFLFTESSFQAHTFKILFGALLTNYFKNLNDNK